MGTNGKGHNAKRFIIVFAENYGIIEFTHLVIILPQALERRQYHDTTDAELLEMFYAGYNNQFLGILLERYTLLLYGVCMKYLKDDHRAKDAVQQIFVKVIDELPRFRVTYFKSWLYIVAKNHCLMQLRKKGNKLQELPDKELWLPQDEQEQEEKWQKEAALQKLEKALPQLSEQQQVCIRLFYLQKCSYQEISEQTSYTLHQVKSYIQNGKRNLKLLMDRMQ